MRRVPGDLAAERGEARDQRLPLGLSERDQRHADRNQRAGNGVQVHRRGRHRRQPAQPRRPDRQGPPGRVPRPPPRSGRRLRPAARSRSAARATARRRGTHSRSGPRPRCPGRRRQPPGTAHRCGPSRGAGRRRPIGAGCRHRRQRRRRSPIPARANSCTRRPEIPARTIARASGYRHRRSSLNVHARACARGHRPRPRCELSTGCPFDPKRVGWSYQASRLLGGIECTFMAMPD